MTDNQSGENAKNNEPRVHGRHAFRADKKTKGRKAIGVVATLAVLAAIAIPTGIAVHHYNASQSNASDANAWKAVATTEQAKLETHASSNLRAQAKAAGESEAQVKWNHLSGSKVIGVSYRYWAATIDDGTSAQAPDEYSSNPALAQAFLEGMTQKFESIQLDATLARQSDGEQQAKADFIEAVKAGAAPSAFQGTPYAHCFLTMDDVKHACGTTDANLTNYEDPFYIQGYSDEVARLKATV